MSTRILSINEIQAVGSILKDKEAIKLLKEIRDNVITEEDTKGKRKNNDVFNFVGFSTSDDLLGGEDDTESEEYKNKKGSIKKLVNAGLVLEGFHVPLERKNEKKYGDQRVADTDDKIYKYQLTNEGYAILSLVEQDESSGSSQPQQKQNKQQSLQQKPNESKEVKEFKASQQKEQKQQEQQKSKEIQAFKAAQEKELKKS